MGGVVILIYIIPEYVSTPCAIIADARYVPSITKKVTITPLSPTCLKSFRSFPIAIPAYASSIVVSDTSSTFVV